MQLRETTVHWLSTPCFKSVLAHQEHGEQVFVSSYLARKKKQHEFVIINFNENAKLQVRENSNNITVKTLGKKLKGMSIQNRYTKFKQNEKNGKKGQEKENNVSKMKRS